MKPRDTAQMSFQDTTEGFEFDASELFRDLSAVGMENARGRLVQAAMEQNHEALGAVLDQIMAFTTAKDKEYLSALTMPGRYKGARTGPTGKVAEIEGRITQIGALALACMYGHPKDPAARMYEKRFASLLSKLLPEAKEKILADMLNNGRDARHASQVARLLTKAVQWHPCPSLALRQLAGAKGFPHLKAPMSDVTGPAISAGLQKMQPAEAQGIFEKHAIAFIPVFLRQGGFKNKDLDRLAEEHVLRMCVEGSARPDQKTSLKALVERHGLEPLPLQQPMVEALSRQIQMGNLETVQDFATIIQRASRSGQFLFLKASVGDAPMLDALINLKAHEQPPAVNLATAMLSRHMAERLNPSHAPAIAVLLKAGADPFQKFARGISDPTPDGAFSKPTGVSLEDMLKNQKSGDAWDTVIDMVAAQKARKALKAVKTPLRRKLASSSL